MSDERALHADCVLVSAKRRCAHVGFKLGKLYESHSPSLSLSPFHSASFILSFHEGKQFLAYSDKPIEESHREI